MRDARAEPLAAIYPRTAQAEVDAAFEGNDFSLQSLTALLLQAGKLRPIEVAHEQEAFFSNINELRDLEIR
jgi:molybdopterin-guanine dinucleotide biosynthesis protein A